ncbi:MAG: hypothetical protein OSJ83_10745, partial [Clostridia bacterium]|nr:hypothetical protein [Clostridia bacterium]
TELRPRRQASTHLRKAHTAIATAYNDVFARRRRCIRRVCGGGTTAIAARKLRRKYICFELDKNYFDIATSRIENEFAQASFLYD